MTVASKHSIALYLILAGLISHWLQNRRSNGVGLSSKSSWLLKPRVEFILVWLLVGWKWWLACACDCYGLGFSTVIWKPFYAMLRRVGYDHFLSSTTEYNNCLIKYPTTQLIIWRKKVKERNAALEKIERKEFRPNVINKKGAKTFRCVATFLVKVEWI